MKTNKMDLGKQVSVYPVTVQVVGSYNEDGIPNIMTASFWGVASMSPAMIYVSLRKATLTYHNLMRERAFTINTPSDQFIAETDYVGIVSGKKTNKFESTGLTPIKSSIINAPFIAEFPIIYECKLTQTVELGTHTMFIAEILNVKANEDVLNDKNKPVLCKIKPIVMGATESSYFSIGNEISNAFHYKDEFPRKY